MGSCSQWGRALSDVEVQGLTAGADHAATAEAPSVSAGALIRAAREEAGVRLPGLAASLKVSVNKLEALEAGDLSVFPDIVFTRALASAVCRALKIDAAPVLAKLPKAPGQGLASLGEGVNTQVAGARKQNNDFPSSKPFPWIGVVALLLVGTCLVLFYPQLSQQWAKYRAESPAPRSAPVARGAESPEPVVLGSSESQVEAVAAPGAAVPDVNGVPSGLAVSAPAPEPVVDANAPVLKFVASKDTWVQVKDGSGKSVLDRVIKAGSEQEISGTPPFKVVVGNVTGAQMFLRGEAFDLNKVSKVNIARFEVN